MIPDNQSFWEKIIYGYLIDLYTVIMQKEIVSFEKLFWAVIYPYSF